ncbi:hypothetical protein IMZ48_30140 [Candidatus Bathyarchaeota archaeon]|nr:hypothetical protein [Candidatus Bathyarchaeota archaeon]
MTGNLQRTPWTLTQPNSATLEEATGFAAAAVARCEAFTTSNGANLHAPERVVPGVISWHRERWNVLRAGG